MRLSAAVLLIGIFGAAAGYGAQHARARDEGAKADAEAAVQRNFDSYRKKVRAPNGQEIDLTPALRRIADGKTLKQAGYPPHAGDGSTFLNLVDREVGRRPLPDKPRGYYVEYVVPPNDGARWPGPQRLIVGRGGEAYYSPQHYDPRSIVELHRSLK